MNGDAPAPAPIQNQQQQPPVQQQQPPPPAGPPPANPNGNWGGPLPDAGQDQNGPGMGDVGQNGGGVTWNEDGDITVDVHVV